MSKKPEIAFVIATKDRPEDLENLLKSLVTQTLLPAQVIVVDGGARSVKNLLKDYSNLNIKYLRVLQPSLTRQRNAGVKAVDKNIPLIGFLDDDAVLEKDSIENMIDFWSKVEKDVGGASFNFINHPPVHASSLKYSFISSKLDLYSNEKGKVSKSGFHTMIGKVDKTIFTEWIFAGASVWRREVLKKYWFDEWFKGYSYLEDLDFSYRVGKKWKLAVVADSRFYHYQASGGRESGFQFGKREVMNRIYFVKKHKELSIICCIIGIIIRLLISAFYMSKKNKAKYYTGRILGNLAGLFESF